MASNNFQQFSVLETQTFFGGGGDFINLATFLYSIKASFHHHKHCDVLVQLAPYKTLLQSHLLLLQDIIGCLAFLYQNL